MRTSAVKPVKLFPDLYNIKPFIHQKHPTYHPDSIKYTKYWETHERRCVEGFWGEDRDGDKGGWRYMPANLYYYINFCVILDEDDKGNTVAVINPLLRDVEWYLAYGWITARGFSGFRDDEHNTSHRIIKKLEKELGDDLYKMDIIHDSKNIYVENDKGELVEAFSNDVITPKEKKNLLKVIDKLLTPLKNFKRYVDAREYLYKTHAKPMGPALFDNTAQNLFVLGSRGFGKSFFTGNAIIGHEFNFFGKKFYDADYLNDPDPVEIFVGSSMASKSTDLLKKYTDSVEWQKKHYGAYGAGDDFLPGYFYLNTSGSLRAGASNYIHEYEYKEGGTWLKGGTGSKIHHGIFTTENPQAAVGTRPTVMVWEEVGLSTTLLDSHAANETCMIRRNKFGSAIYIGTGGNMEKIEESKIIFEDPEAYDFVPYVDHWEKRSKPIGLFMPAYYVDNDFKDENGNTDLEAAFQQEMIERKKREKAANSAALDGYMMSRPIVPSEMFLSPTANIFPTAKLRERLTDIEVGNKFKNWASIGMLNYTTPEKKDVHWDEDVSRVLKPITLMNLDTYKGNFTGAIVVYEHPQENTPLPKYKNALYKVVYDPIKDDGEGTSLASIIVYKGFSKENWNEGTSDDIVAEYIGRYDRVNQIHEIAVKLALYYNAKILVENNLPDFIRYCKMTNRFHLLQPTPYLAISKAIRNPGKKYDVGVTMSKQLGIHSEQLLRQWLLEPWKVSEDDQKTYFNLNKIKSPRILAELINYTREGNYDHVSSLKLLALWLSQEAEIPVKENEEETKVNTYKDLENAVRSRMRSKKKNKFYAY